MRGLLPGALALVLTGCADLTTARAYRCENNDGCADKWVCLKDKYCHNPAVGVEVACDNNAGCTGEWVCLKDKVCHDPAVGAEVACEDTKTDCTGGWFCAQEQRCRDPGKPGAFPCDEDTQCAGAWRCSSEHRCVDLSKEPLPRPFPLPSGPPTLQSPLTEPADPRPGDLLRTSPIQFFTEQEYSYVSYQAVRARGATLEVSHLVWEPVPFGAYFGTSRDSVQLPEAPLDLAISRGRVLVQQPTGLRLVGDDGGLEPVVDLPWVERLVPLAWNETDGGAQGAFVAIGDGGAALINVFGVVTQTLRGVIDVAGTGRTLAAGVPELVVLGESDGGQALFMGGVLMHRFPAAGTTDYQGRPSLLRVESESIAVNYTLPAPIPQGPSSYPSSVVCQDGGCDGPTAPGLQCTPPAPGASGQPADFALSAPGQVRLACSNDGYDFLYDFRDGEALTYFDARQAALSWGTSRGHVRQSRGGQLSWSQDLDGELTDVLATRPETFGVRGDDLVGVSGRFLYAKSPRVDTGLPLGLSLFLWVKPPYSLPVAFVEGEDLTLFGSGVVSRSERDGGETYPFVLPVDPAPSGNIARMLQVSDGGRVLVVTTGDGLYVGAEDEQEDLTLLAATLRPAPGFSISEWALRPTDGGFLEGWAVANNRLFRVTASSVDRWKSSELPVTGRDPISVWFSGEAVQLGTASGEVLSLPSRVPVVPPLPDEVTSMTGLCGAIFATTPDAVWEVVPADGGRGAWSKTLADLYRPMLQRSDGRLFILDEDGVVLELPVSCP